MTPPELALWFQLRGLRDAGWHFRRQAPEGPYILDFVCRRAKLVVEVDGSHHGDSAQSDHDRRRDRYLEQRGLRILRFWASDVIGSIDHVMNEVRSALGAGDAPLADDAVPSQNDGPRYRRLVRLGMRRRH